jgi:hypothetical protein
MLQVSAVGDVDQALRAPCHRGKATVGDTPQVGVQPTSTALAGLPPCDLEWALAEPDAGPPEPVISKSEFFSRSLPADAITKLLNTFTTARQHRELNFTPMGSAYNRFRRTQPPS